MEDYPVSWSKRWEKVKAVNRPFCQNKGLVVSAVVGKRRYWSWTLRRHDRGLCAVWRTDWRWHCGMNVVNHVDSIFILECFNQGWRMSLPLCEVHLQCLAWLKRLWGRNGRSGSIGSLYYHRNWLICFPKAKQIMNVISDSSAVAILIWQNVFSLWMLVWRGRLYLQ